MRQTWCRSIVPAILMLSAWFWALWLGASPAPAEAATRQTAATQGWLTYKNPRFGFQLSYPGGLLLKAETQNTTDGAIWATADGSARLLATATSNETAETLASYRAFVMRETYPDALFDYTPIREKWFVLSGQKGGMMFYERITFVCGGRYIYGWQMNYPVDQRRRFDAIVEAIHRSYKPGRGEDGNCKA